MTDTQANNRRIARNTLMLYLRMLLIVAVGIYTSRVVLNTLGVEDYGIYNVVGGVVAMMGFLNASLAGATSRFITFELGRGDRQRLADTFSSALIAHIGIALAVVLVAETAGLWFVTHKLVIPEARMDAALWVYHLSIASAAIGITQVPYTACVIAHERMGVYAYMEILNSVLKLLIVYVLLAGHFDKLKLYATLTFAVSTLIAAIYRLYCTRKFAESHFRWTWNKEILRPMVSFSAWDVYGNLSVSANSFGTNSLLNMFFGPVVNAAAGIAYTFAGYMTVFATNVSMAFRPHIIKQYATGDIDGMEKALCSSAKFTSFLMLLCLIPMAFETDYILGLWLGKVPKYCPELCRITLVAYFFSILSQITCTAVHAAGNIKSMSIYTGTTLIITLVPTYILLRVGLNCYSVFAVMIPMYAANFLINAYFAKKHIPEIHIMRYIYVCIIPNLVIAAISGCIAFAISNSFSMGIMRLTICTAATIASSSIVAYFILFNKAERENAYNFIKQKLSLCNR